MDKFSESEFRRRVDQALQEVKTVLDNNRNPQYPADVHHTYDDKYLLANYVVNTYLAAQLNALQALGLTSESLAQLKDWSTSRSVTLRLAGEERCTFLRKAERKIDPSSEYVEEYKSSSGVKSKWTSKVVKKVTEWFWKFEVEYQIIAVKGSGSSSKEKTVLVSRTADCELVTTTDDAPRPKVSLVSPVDVQITWMLQQLSKDNVFDFAIDRAAKACHTPRRNPEVDAAVASCTRIHGWVNGVRNYFISKLIPTQKDHELDLTPLNDDGIFSPIVPLFEEGAKNGDKEAAAADMLASLPADAESAVLLSSDDANAFLALQKQTITGKFEKFDKLYPLKGLITSTEARIVAMCGHMGTNANNLSRAVMYVEHLLRTQLIAAIGKVVGPVEFDEYMRFHNRKLFKEEFAPKPYSYAVRRPDHSPEGTLSIEASAGSAMAEPIFTVVRHSVARAPMHFPINAATSVSFLGDRYLHAWIGHKFSNAQGLSLQLTARARQFSSFILLVGQIAGASVFQPKFGMIVQNKDDLKVPLLLETIPTPKEFRDAIESLSPEQQRFAKAFRSMQLESTLFGVAVIQIKPQLEKLLKLPDDSLTKEIRLTQDLLELFITYQIPSDLLSYDGEEEASTREKLDVVKGYVKAMQEMIQSKKEAELADKKLETAYACGGILEDLSYPSPVPTPKSANLFKVKKKRKAAPMRKAAKGGRSMAAKPSAAPAPAQVPKPAKPAKPAQPAPADPKPEAKAEEPKEPMQAGDMAEGTDESGCEDFTKYPALLDEKYAALDEDNALRPTILKPGQTWTKKFQKTLLAKVEEKNLSVDDQRDEKAKAFDLLDALSRSGALTVNHADLHVVMAATHCFDLALMDTVVQDNVNPIEKVERSTLIVATTIHDKPAEALVRADRLDAARAASPALFDNCDALE